MANKLVGENYSTPDLIAKVTGKARYAEDWRVDGMLFCKLLTSPMPHARVRRLDTSKAMAMPGVKAILTADEMPAAGSAGTRRGGRSAASSANSTNSTKSTGPRRRGAWRPRRGARWTAGSADRRLEVD